MIAQIAGGLRVTVATLAALGVAGHHAAAQSLVYASSQATGSFSTGPVRLIEVPLTPTGPGGITRSIELPGRLRSTAAIMFGGRYVGWLRSADANAAAAFLEILDRRTGQISTSGIEVIRPTTLLADPAALRLFAFSTAASGSSLIDSITVIESSGSRSFSIAPVSMLGPLSADGRKLFVMRRVTVNDQSTNQVFAIDPTTGAETRALPPLPPNLLFPAGFDLSADERRLYVSNSSSVRVFETESGTELAHRTFSLELPSQESLGPIALDERYNRLFVPHIRLSGSAGGNTSTFVLDAISLETLHADAAGGAALVVDPVQQITFARGGFIGRFGCGQTTVGTWGAAAAPIASFTVLLDGGCPSFSLAPAPRPPTLLSTVVNGRRVTLQWPPTMSAHDYEIEAGSGTGLTDLARVRTGGATTLTVDGVPPGTYYVRVLAVSDVGIGPASIERTIVVQ